MRSTRSRGRWLPAAFVFLFALATGRAAEAADPDPWFGRDKLLHFSASAVIAGGTYAVSAPFFEARYPPLLIGAGVTLAIGGIKEGIDATGVGDPSWKDFTWDVIGTAAGLLLAYTIDLAIRGVSDRHPLLGLPASRDPSLTSRGSSLVLRW